MLTLQRFAMSFVRAAAPAWAAGTTWGGPILDGGREGSACGGIVGFQCAEGFECDAPAHPDAMGRCVRKR